MTQPRVLGIAAILIAIAMWVGAGAVALTSFASVATWNSPGSTSVSLEPGTWMLFEQVPEGKSSAVTPSQVSGERTMTVEQFKVVDPQGANVPLTCVYCDTTASTATPLDLKLYNAVASFTAATAGSYQLTAESTTAIVAVGNPLVTIADITPWITVLAGIGGIFLAAGIVLFVRGGRRRSATVPVTGNGPPAIEQLPPASGPPPTRTAGAPPPPPGSSPPAGWYPNPYLPGTTSEMWWNGKEWTSNWR